jgi:hypothetical protein
MDGVGVRSLSAQVHAAGAAGAAPLLRGAMAMLQGWAAQPIASTYRFGARLALQQNQFG